MPSAFIPDRRRLLSFLFCLPLLVPFPARAQQQQQPAPSKSETPPQQPSQQQPSPDVPAEQDEEVVRVNAELVQTDVMVFDKQGRFVEGLQPAQFELRVDGKPQSISFFEMVRAGSVNEDMQLAAARGNAQARVAAGADGANGVRPLDRGRTIFFFVDDLHLSAGNVPRTRQLMLNFVEEMGQNDETAITSASGQIGFLQQLTREKMVLRKAIARLNFRQNTRFDMERPPMSEYNALAIARRDPSVTEYFVNEWIRANSGGGNAAALRSIAETAVRARADSLLRQSAHVTQQTLASLESLVRSVAPLPGRKILFFISEGFYLNDRSSNVISQLRRVTDAAARTGTVIYSMDARGLVSGIQDASTEAAFDPTGTLIRSSIGEFSAAQDGLHALAADTGGRAVFNKNRLDAEVKNALKETEVYYLLAWTPPTGTGATAREGKFRSIEVKVVGRPDLSVRVRRGYLVERPAARNASQPKRNAPVSDKKPPTAVTELVAALRSLHPRGELPTSLFVGYADVPNMGAMLTTMVQIDASTLDFGTEANRQNAKLDLVGLIFDEQGKTVSTIQQELIVSSSLKPDAKNRGHITYSQPHRLAPGLYQVRVAAREDKQGRIGSATQWIQIPDIQKGAFSLSSIFISEQRAGQQPSGQTATPATAEAADKSAEAIAQPSVGRRFARTSKLQFLLSIYNAARQTAPPDVALQIQVFRDNQPVITTPLRKVDTKEVKDLARIPYAAEFALDALSAGQYVLQITAIDRAAKASATQRLDFTVE